MPADEDVKLRLSADGAAELQPVTDAVVELHPSDGVRYTVPEIIHITRMDAVLTVRFRSDRVYKNCYVNVYFDDERMIHRKRLVVTPGEMEEIKLRKEQLLNVKNLKSITVKIEEE